VTPAPAPAWPRLTARWAAAVLAGYGAVALWWLAGGPYPWAVPGNPDSNFRDHWLADAPAGVVEGITLVVTGATLLALAAMHRDVTGRRRPVVLAVAVCTAVLLVLVLPGNLSLFLIPGFNLLPVKRVAWPEVHVVLLASAGFALALATLAYARRTAGRCEECGRGARPGWSRARWTRVGRAAAYVATVAPLGYAVMRLLWAAGVPVGATEEFLADLRAANEGNGTVLMEIALATMATGGGLLCFGLTRPWSETWPRWVVGLAGRPVPRWFPTGLATLCGAGLFGFASLLAPDLLRFLSGETVHYPGTRVRTDWLSHVPEVALIVWSVAVLVSAISFHYRTQPPCRVCSRAFAGQMTSATTLSA